MIFPASTVAAMICETVAVLSSGKFGGPRVDALCVRALAFDVLDVRCIERLLKTAQRVEDSAESTGKLITLPSTRFARDPASFSTRNSDDKGGAQ